MKPLRPDRRQVLCNKMASLGFGVGGGVGGGGGGVGASGPPSPRLPQHSSCNANPTMYCRALILGLPGVGKTGKTFTQTAPIKKILRYVGLLGIGRLHRNYNNATFFSVG